MTDDRPTDPLFDALADATRRRVLVALATAGPSTSTQLASAFPVTRQAIAKHLQVLAAAGVVQAEHRGRETQWTFVPGSLAAAAGWLEALDGQERSWDDTVDAWQRHLDEQRRKRGLAPPDSGGLRAAASKRPTR
jgi:DNA-binding transcriptional ArsR family regulator